jgi:hypothetical protein
MTYPDWRKVKALHQVTIGFASNTATEYYRLGLPTESWMRSGAHEQERFAV